MENDDSIYSEADPISDIVDDDPDFTVDFKQEILIYFPKATDRSIVSLFGVTPTVMNYIYFKFDPQQQVICKPSYLLWAFALLKTYLPEDALQAIFKVNWKTFHEHAWHVIDYLSQQMEFLIDRRLVYSDHWIDIGDHFGISTVVDATECYIEKPSDVNLRTSTYSGYKKRTTLKYNVVATLSKGLIVHVDGPHDGPTHEAVALDVSEYLEGLDDGEHIIADQKYHSNDEDRIITALDVGFQDQDTFHNNRAKIEHLFAKLKVFGILSGAFRHDLSKHMSVFTLLCAIHNLRVLRDI